MNEADWKKTFPESEIDSSCSDSSDASNSDSWTESSDSSDSESDSDSDSDSESEDDEPEKHECAYCGRTVLKANLVRHQATKTCKQKRKQKILQTEKSG